MNICNMPEIANINIHKHDGRYYLKFIAWDEAAEKLNVSDGLWEEVEISQNDLEQILSVISKTDYTKTRGRELDFFTSINGTPYIELGGEPDDKRRNHS